MSAKSIIILGAGPAGYVGAIRAGKLGLKVTLVEKNALGGTCLNRGCIPSKALLHSGLAFAEARALFPGLLPENASLSVDWAEIRKRKNEAIAALKQGVTGLLRGAKVEVVQGEGRIVSSREVAVKDAGGKESILKADAILVATGSEASRPGPLKVEHPAILTSTEALELQTRPTSVVVVGAGAVGIEFSRFYACFGIPVTLVEMLDRCLPGADPEMSKLIESSLTSRGITVMTKKKVLEVKPDKKGVSLLLDDGKEVRGDIVLVAAGRAVNTRGVGLDTIGVQMSPAGIVKVSPQMETSVSGVYAAGDVTGGWMLAHKASAEALAAVQSMAGQPRPVRYETIPACVYGEPEVASVGATEEGLKQKGIAYVTGKFKYAHLGRAWAEGKKEGLFKVLADPRTGEIYGVHVVGQSAAELIHEACLAIRLEATVEELMATVHAHPSFSEGLWEATGAAFGRAIHG